MGTVTFIFSFLLTPVASKMGYRGLWGICLVRLSSLVYDDYSSVLLLISLLLIISSFISFSSSSPPSPRSPPPSPLLLFSAFSSLLSSFLSFALDHGYLSVCFPNAVASRLLPMGRRNPRSFHWSIQRQYERPSVGPPLKRHHRGENGMSII